MEVKQSKDSDDFKDKTHPQKQARTDALNSQN